MRYYFDNGYGASIVSDYLERGTYELAVLSFNREHNEWELDYSTPITDDVLRCLTMAEVEETLEEIKNL